MTTIYNDAGEREIRAVVLHANANKLYTTAKHDVEIDHDTALDLCTKNLLRIFDTDTYYSVSSFKDSDGTLTVGYGDSKTATVGPAAILNEE